MLSWILPVGDASSQSTSGVIFDGHVAPAESDMAECMWSHGPVPTDDGCSSTVSESTSQHRAPWPWPSLPSKAETEALEAALEPKRDWEACPSPPSLPLSLSLSLSLSLVSSMATPRVKVTKVKEFRAWMVKDSARTGISD